MTLRREMTAQHPAGSVTDIEFPDQCRIMHFAPAEIVERLGATTQLLPIERCCLLENSTGISFRSDLGIEAGQALAER